MITLEIKLIESWNIKIGKQTEQGAVPPSN